jgi:hypothetical protein
MPRIVKCGLIQTSMACGADEPIATIRSANLDKTLEFVDRQGARRADAVHAGDLH